MGEPQRILVSILGFVVVLMLVSCAPAPRETEAMIIPTPTASLELKAFISLAENANCAEDRNQLYVIDGQYVLHTTEGWCMDAGYDHTLYGFSVKEELCTLEDSFVGPLSKCEPEFEQIFETILQNLDQSDLGLGAEHSVELFFEKDNGQDNE